MSYLCSVQWQNVMNGEQGRCGVRWLWHIWTFWPCISFRYLKKTKSIWRNCRSAKRHRNPLPLNRNIQRFHNMNLFGDTDVHVESSFETLRKATIIFVFFVSLFFRPLGTTRLPLYGFSWNLISQYFSKVCRENSSFIKMWHYRRFTRRQYLDSS